MRLPRLLKPFQPLLTPMRPEDRYRPGFWTYLFGLILAAGAVVTVLRFWKGLGAVTNLSDRFPWGLWIGFDVLCGVALAAGGFTITAAVYVFNLKRFKPIVRPTVLTAFLGYTLVAVGLMYDLGKPWNIWHPIIMWNPRSPMFEVGWCVMLYLTVLALEFSGVVFEKLGWKKAIAVQHAATVPLVIAGVIISTLHQSSLGTFYLITPGKLHPLWYSSQLPLLFFSSAVYAAMSFAILLAFVGVRYFRDKCDEEFLRNTPLLTLSLGKGAALSIYIYFALKVLALAQDDRWGLLLTPYGYWYLLELIGFVAIPMVLFTVGIKRGNLGIIRFAALQAVLGIVLNRFNVNLIAYNWQQPNHIHHIIPPVTEVIMVVAMVTLHVLVFRWILNRFPVMRELPEYKGTH